MTHPFEVPGADTDLAFVALFAAGLVLFVATAAWKRWRRRK